MTTTEDPGKELEVRPDTELEPLRAGELEPLVDEPVVDAELVPPPRLKPVTIIGTIVKRPVHSAAALSKSPVVRKGATKALAPPRIGIRTTYTIGQGFSSWARRAWDAGTHGKLRRLEDAAETGRDHETLLKARAALEKARNDRQARMLRLPLIFAACIAFVICVCVATFVVLTLFAIAVRLTPGGSTWDSWWAGVGIFLDTAAMWLRWAVFIAACAAPFIVVWAAWREGKRNGRRPRWMVTRDEQLEMDSFIDERMISMALAKVGIAELAKFFADGGQLHYLVVPRKDGDGTYAQVDLPMGVTADQIAEPKPRAKLAGNLKRATLECWPTKSPNEDGILDLWVADKGKLNTGAGPWPLLDDGDLDVFEGVPFGRSQRGDVIVAPIFEANYLIGGRPGQGKSSAMRTLMLGAALDPTVELWAFVFGESPDFDPFRPRLTRYAMGLDDEVFEQAIQALRDLLAEMERRGKLLRTHNTPRTNRKLANKPGLGLHILVAAFDEVHELFMHPQYGKEAADLMIRLVRRGRKYGVILINATQAPTADSIPRDVTRQTACGVAFSVQDHVANDGLLGTGKYKAGIRATELRFNMDRGTCVSVGITKNIFELIRTFYIPFAEGVDDVTPVIHRAMTNIKELRRTAEPKVIEQPTKTNHLQAIWDVLEAPREELRDVLPRLRDGNPETYRGWNQKRLIEELETVWEVPVGTLDGYRVVLSADVEQAIERHSGSVDEDD